MHRESRRRLGECASCRRKSRVEASENESSDTPPSIFNLLCVKCQTALLAKWLLGRVFGLSYGACAFHYTNMGEGFVPNSTAVHAHPVTSSPCHLPAA